MKKTMLSAAVAVAALAMPAAAHAGSNEGKLQIKLLATGVLPDGDISRVNNAAAIAGTPLAANPHTYASDTVVPTVAIEYFFNPNVAGFAELRWRDLEKSDDTVGIFVGLSVFFR